MKYIKLFEQYNKNLQPYEGWELGLIKAWGHVLYLAYHNLPIHIEKKISDIEFREVMIDYYKNSDDDEDLQDWMADEPPTMNKGYAVFDKNRITNCFEQISNKIIIEEPLIVYRSSEFEQEGWNSYSTKKGGYYGIEREYLLPIGTNIINADNIADQNEVILNLSRKQLTDYLTK